MSYTFMPPADHGLSWTVPKLRQISLTRGVTTIVTGHVSFFMKCSCRSISIVVATLILKYQDGLGGQYNPVTIWQKIQASPKDASRVSEPETVRNLLSHPDSGGSHVGPEPCGKSKPVQQHLITVGFRNFHSVLLFVWVSKCSFECLDFLHGLSWKLLLDTNHD
jgi:hypothetical protein